MGHSRGRAEHTGVTTTTPPSRSTLGSPEHAHQHGWVVSIVHHPRWELLGERALLPLGARVPFGRAHNPFDAEGALDDKGISRIHLMLDVHSAHVIMIDESRHGTSVNGARYEEAVLHDGDVIEVGPVLLLLRHTAWSYTAPASAAIIGRSWALSKVWGEVARCSGVDYPVLIRGETGSGKELIARAVHDRSSRAGGPYVTFNCAALDPNLVVATLFGHEKGAFTGAIKGKVGKFEEAHSGTLLLDEIGDLPAEAQAAVLRTIQHGEIQVLGGDTKKVDVRILTATHKDLAEEVKMGRFRKDLFHRLDVLNIHVPPLRERVEDIPLLARHLLHHYDAGKRPPRRSLMVALLRHPWPGNVRELENVLRQASSETPHDKTTIELTEGVERKLHEARRHFTAEPAEAPVADSNARSAERKPSSPRGGARHAKPTKVELEEHLRRHAGNINEVGRALAVGRSSVYRWMEELGLDPNLFRRG